MRLVFFKVKAVSLLPGMNVQPAAVSVIPLMRARIRQVGLIPPLRNPPHKRIPIKDEGNGTMGEHDLWEALGSLSEDECEQVLTQLFSRYEERRHADSSDKEAATFFNYLSAIISQVQSCNINRR